ncbi:MAG TPA: hypothetical protein VM286_07405 [Candidatus Thermoplasmatota archaeon]|nr:hypothetical protein [Candidatus Thermoplasmatota archaeon]
MRGRFLSTMLVALLAAQPVLAEAAGDDRAERRTEAMARWTGLGAVEQANGLEAARDLGLFGQFTYTAGATPTSAATVAGRFLKFSVQPSTERVTGLQVRADGSLAALFAKVLPDRPQTVANPFVGGPAFLLPGSLVDLSAHDDPLASMTWRASARVDLTFVPASGIKPTLTDKHEAQVPIGGRHVHLVSDGAASIKLLSNGTLTIPLALNESVTLRLHPAAGADWLHDLVSAQRTHRLGAVLRLAETGGTPLVDGDASDVRVRTTRLAPGHASWNVSSLQHASRILFLTLPNGTLDTGRLGAVAVTLDGTALPHQATAAKVLAASGGAVALLPHADGQAITLVVAIPSFSAYDLDVLQPPAPPAGPPPVTVTVTVTRPQRDTPAPVAAEAALLLLLLAAAARRRA